MKIFSVFIILFSIICFSSCSKEDNWDETIRVVDISKKVNQADSIEIPINNYAEGTMEIIRQTRNYQVSELRDEDYFYKPEKSFVGEDQVEILITGGTTKEPIKGILRITLEVEIVE